MNVVYSVFERSPKSEVLFRRTLSKLPCIKKIATRIYNEDSHKNENLEVKAGQWDAFQKCVKENIYAGDMVLVHSSIKGMATLGVSAMDVIKLMLDVVGPEGTLIFPSYPDLKRMEKKDDRYVYDPATTSPWTGKLCREFLALDGVVRSEFPHNTLAALGPQAEMMMRENLNKTPYSQGAGSAWDYAIHHGMKILYLGVKAPTSCTIVHYAEDILENDWPVRDWYEKHEYYIKNNTNGELVKYDTLERRKKWFDYYCMFHTGYKLRQLGYLREYDVDGVYVGVMDRVEEMCDYLIDNAREGKLLFDIPRKFRK